MIDRISTDTLNFSKEIQDKLDAEGIILVREDDLDCMEDDYEEACDRLISCGAIAKEGLKINDIISAHDKFDEILTEVES